MDHDDYKDMYANQDFKLSFDFTVKNVMKGAWLTAAKDFTFDLKGS
jgi:hypothetical protein